MAQVEWQVPTLPESWAIDAEGSRRQQYMGDCKFSQAEVQDEGLRVHGGFRLGAVRGPQLRDMSQMWRVWSNKR